MSRRGARRVHRAGDHGVADGREPARRGLRADGLQPHARAGRGVRRRARRDGRRHAGRRRRRRATSSSRWSSTAPRSRRSCSARTASSTRAAEGTLCVDMSTIAPADTRRDRRGARRARHRLRRRAGDRFVAEGRGRDADDHGRRDRGRFARARPLFEVMGEVVVHVGELGQGQTVKLINNAVAATNAEHARPGAHRRQGDGRRPRRARAASWAPGAAAARCSA